MTYTELKDNPEENEHIVYRSDCVAYSEIVGALFITMMLCGTLLMITQMWVGKREMEINYLRDITP
jgi:hypothetical protein